jgi:hypothetical protein
MRKTPILLLPLAILLMGADPVDSDAPMESLIERDEQPRAAKLNWHISFAGKAERRSVSFKVSDAACAYDLMQNPTSMVDAIPFLHQADAFDGPDDDWELEVRERFFLVGDAHSRYHRTATSDRVEWVLLWGRAKRHDGSWRVERQGKGATVHFTNVIVAKNFLHQGLLNGIQKRSMTTIVEVTQERCGAGEG